MVSTRSLFLATISIFASFSPTLGAPSQPPAQAPGPAAASPDIMLCAADIESTLAMQKWTEPGMPPLTQPSNTITVRGNRKLMSSWQYRCRKALPWTTSIPETRRRKADKMSVIWGCCYRGRMYGDGHSELSDDTGCLYQAFVSVVALNHLYCMHIWVTGEQLIGGENGIVVQRATLLRECIIVYRWFIASVYAYNYFEYAVWLGPAELIFLE